MNKSYFNLLFFILLCSNFTFAQIQVVGYVFEENNRGMLNESYVFVIDNNSDTIATAVTNEEGSYTFKLPLNQNFKVYTSKDNFEIRADDLSTFSKEPKIYVKTELKRKPGYMFDVTLAEKRMDNAVATDGIMGAKIEIYNNTLLKEEMVLDDYQHTNFNFNFLPGNHYTILIRKDGYLNKRLEAYVNVKGCIICFDGLSNVRPEVTDNLTEKNTKGTILANIELQELKLNKAFKIENIYYDYNKWDIRADAAVELNKVITLLKENPSLIMELGSHTDSRGDDAYNLELSEKRAKSAVEFITQRGAISNERLKAKGYGETELVNRCANGVNCTEIEHQMNRRTELKLLGFLEDPYKTKSLEDILREERMELMLKELENQKEVVIQPGQEFPIQEDTAKQNQENWFEFKDVANNGSTDVFNRFFTISPKTVGYKIQIITSSTKLKRTDTVFDNYSKVYEYKMNSKEFAYFIGDFESKTQAEDFIKQNVSIISNNSSILKFQNGIIIK
ncbi:MAG: OmpA family protein [Saprospiraceae bacterium]|nr:OmpA family protein [Saprospiraceae bacterium]